MVSSPATPEAGVHAAGDTKSEHFEPARVRKLNEKQFSSSRGREIGYDQKNFLFQYLNSSSTIFKSSRAAVLYEIYSDLIV
jgi:hypothetical protein